MLIKFTIFATLLIGINSHVPVNRSDVIVTFESHSDAVAANSKSQKQDHVVEMRQTDAVPPSHEPATVAPTIQHEISDDPGCTCATSATNKDDIYDVHNELSLDFTDSPPSEIDLNEQNHQFEPNHHTGHVVTENADEVIFIPNDPDERVPIPRSNPPQVHSDTIHDVISEHTRYRNSDTLSDLLMHAKSAVNIRENDDVGENIFIAGKNEAASDVKESEMAKKEKKKNSKFPKPETSKKVRVNCNTLQCNSKDRRYVCGGKLENNKWKYRLFLNECYLNLVNCQFKVDMNQYLIIDMRFCSQISATNTPRPALYHPPPVPKHLRKTPDSVELLQNTRRAMQSRRSMSIDRNGEYCSHICPAICTNAYEPVCAVSSEGNKRVFENHCKLDYESCMTFTAWQTKPLSLCVGQSAADVRNNRHFIAWMQNIGIVDSKGRFNRA